MHYFLWGILVIFLSVFFAKKHHTDNSLPCVSLIVAAYNEEKIIHQKILNDLQLDYPKDKIEIIIVTDGSNDQTPLIASHFSNDGIITLHHPVRRGKTSALNRAVLIARNDIVIFSDANSFFRPDAIRKLVRHFADSSIGGVCGKKSIRGNSDRLASAGDKLFWKYEATLKSAESFLGSIPTADGEIFAIRKNLYIQLNSQIINDDMAITFNIVSENRRVIYDNEAITEEEASITLRDDFHVKSRMVYGSIQMLKEYQVLLNPFLSFYGLQFFFHKTLRYFMWALLVSIFILNILCHDQNIFFKYFLNLQIVFYSMATLGYIFDKRGYKTAIFYFPYYYCNVNLAAFVGYWYYLQEKPSIEIWKKAVR